jgi:hypothetical protein
MDSPTQKPQRLLTFRSGGWVILLAALASAYAVVWLVVQQRQLVGDGRHPETYGFDLSGSLVPRGEIVASGFPKDGLLALTDPETISAEEVDFRNRGRAKFLLPEDMVVGVSLGGEDRAYPLQILALHEVVNDTLGGQPIVVTYNPLCHSAVVMDRSVDGRTLAFGVSGLLYNSNLLLYDRHADEPQAESLWSQLQFRAIAGPAAAGRATLRLVRFQLARWEDWRAGHTATRVLAGDPAFAKEYPRRRYSTYFATEEIRFPVEPLWSDPLLPKKTPVAAVRAGRRWHVLVLPRLKSLSPEDLAAALRLDDSLKVEYVPESETVRVSPVAPGADCEVVYSFLFAWYAHHPKETRLVP